MSSAPSCTPDLSLLFRTLSPALERLVRRSSRAPQPVVEDACQFAWGQLLAEDLAPGRDGVFPWLARTAIREACRQVRRERCAEEVRGGSPEPADPRPGPDERVEHRQRLDDLRRLPARQQRVLWLQALGLSYAEIARVSGCTTRTVERQVLRARRTLRRVDAA